MAIGEIKRFADGVNHQVAAEAFWGFASPNAAPDAQAVLRLENETLGYQTRPKIRSQVSNLYPVPRAH